KRRERNGRMTGPSLIPEHFCVCQMRGEGGKMGPGARNRPRAADSGRRAPSSPLSTPVEVANRTDMLLLMLILGLASFSFGCVLPRAETLTILSTLSERQSRAVAEAFQAETGIRTLYVRIASAEAPQRLALERGRPFFSVWWGGELEDVLAAAGEGWLEPYLPPSAAALPAVLRDPDGRWFAVYLDPIALAINRPRLAQRGLATPA